MASLCTVVGRTTAESMGRTGGGAGAGARMAPGGCAPVGGAAVAGKTVEGVVAAGARAAEDAEVPWLAAPVAEGARAPDNGGAEVHAVAPSSPARSAAMPAR